MLLLPLLLLSLPGQAVKFLILKQQSRQHCCSKLITLSSYRIFSVGFNGMWKYSYIRLFEDVILTAEAL
jgi:hypothetical protein